MTYNFQLISMMHLCATFLMFHKLFILLQTNIRMIGSIRNPIAFTSKKNTQERYAISLQYEFAFMNRGDTLKYKCDL